MKKLKSGVFTRFNLLILIQVIMLAVPPALLILIGHADYLTHTRYIILGLWVVQVALLYWFIANRDHKTLDVIRTLRNETGYQNLGKSFKNLSNQSLADEIHNLIEAYRISRIASEKDLTFFKTIMQYLPIGVMVVDESEQIRWVNHEMEKLFGVHENLMLTSKELIHPGIDTLLKSLTHKDSATSRVHIQGETRYLFSRCSSIKMKENFTVISVQDIREEVHRQENITLKRMLRVLSHEMVNSLNPISFLIYGLQKAIEQHAAKPDEHLIEKVTSGLQTINKRTKGLTDFINIYNKLIHIPDPNPARIRLTDIAHEVSSLFEEEFCVSHIIMDIQVTPSDLTMISDQSLLTQVLINLVKNAREALTQTQNPAIALTIEDCETNIRICVHDNGEGIPSDHLVDIFQSFFTTREQGSGLGLSFSNEVIKRLGGEIHVTSKQGETCFTIVLPKVMEKPTPKLSRNPTTDNKPHT